MTTRFQLLLQSAARHGFPFAIVGNASWLGCGACIDYIISKHKTEAAAKRALTNLSKVRNDLRLVATEQP